MFNVRSTTNFSTRLSLSKLRSILPQHVIAHKYFTKHELMSLQTVTVLLNYACVIDKDEVDVLSDLRSLNFSDADELHGKFGACQSTVYKVVELSGSEAHRRRHAINSNVDTNVSCVCRSQLNSVCQLAAATLKNLTEEIKLKEKEECMVPSQEHLRLQFSPSYHNRLMSIRITEMLNIKRITTKKNGRALHEHAHFVAALNILMLHDLVNCRKQLEEEELDVDSSLTLS